MPSERIPNDPTIYHGGHGEACVKSTRILVH